MRIAVLGLGSAGRRHAKNLVDLGHEVIGFDPEAQAPSGIQRAKTQHEAIRLAEAVIIASPSAMHAGQATVALDAGRPVLVEKPLATTTEDAREVTDLAQATGLVCAVAMNMRFHPGVLRLRELISERRLGDVHFARASFGYDLRRWRAGTDYRLSYSARSELGGGIVFDAIHELDYLRWLLGPVESVAAETDHLSALEVDVEDVALGILRFRSGALGAVELNFFEPAYRRGCLIAGSKGVAEWSWAEERVKLSGEGEPEVSDVPSDPARTYVEVVDDFIQSLSPGPGEPRTDAGDGLAAVELAEAIKRAARDGRRVSLPVR